MGIRRELRPVVLAYALVAGPVLAQEAPPGDHVRGRDLAERWCEDCHELAPGSRRPWAVAVPRSRDGEVEIVEAPSFQMIADDPAATWMALDAVLRTPHAAMPDLRLAPDEIGDLVAYILSLGASRHGT